MSSVDSKIERFIDKFSLTSSTLKADENGFIKASEFRRAGSKDLSSPQYRALMKLAVDRGCAVDNGMSQTHSKYAIRFNSSPVKVTLFDEDLFMDAAINYLPPLYLLPVDLYTNVETIDNEDWKECNSYWSSIVESLIIYQKTGVLPGKNNKLLQMALKKWICVYEILKYVWTDIELADPLKKGNYNNCFKCIFICASISHWENLHKNLINRPHTQRKHLSNIKNNGVNRKDIEGLLQGITWDRGDDVAERYAALNWLKEAAKQSKDHRVKRALKQLETQQDIEDAVYTIVNRLSDKKRQEKYAEKHIT